MRDEKVKEIKKDKQKKKGHKSPINIEQTFEKNITSEEIKELINSIIQKQNHHLCY